MAFLNDETRLPKEGDKVARVDFIGSDGLCRIWFADAATGENKALVVETYHPDTRSDNGSCRHEWAMPHPDAPGLMFDAERSVAPASYSSIPAVRNYEARLRIVELAIQNRAITVNELRAELGFPPRNDGDQIAADY